MTPDLTPSSALRRAMGKELERFQRTRDKLMTRRGKLEGELRAIQLELEELDEHERLLRAAGADAGPHDRTEGSVSRINARSGKLLKGAAIREKAARKVFVSHGVGRPLHYKEWMEALLEDGYEIVGQDPAATFLTNLNRSPVVRRGAERATYEIDAEAPQRLRAESAEVEAELRDLTEVLARRGDDDPELGEHRDRLVSRMRRLEDLIAEAERVLAPAENVGEDPIRAAA